MDLLIIMLIIFVVMNRRERKKWGREKARPIPTHYVLPDNWSDEEVEVPESEASAQAEFDDACAELEQRLELGEAMAAEESEEDASEDEDGDEGWGEVIYAEFVDDDETPEVLNRRAS